MQFIKLSSWLFVIIAIMSMMTFTLANRPGDKIHFPNSSDSVESDNNDHPGNAHHGNRNHHRGRGRGHKKDLKVPEFEEALPGLYPVRGPPPAPVVLPSQPGQGVSFQKPTTTTTTTTTTNSVPAHKYEIYNYANNPNLSDQKSQPSVIVTNKFNPSTNQLPSSDKPITTTPYNPRRTDLLYGSNLALDGKDREGKSTTIEPEFDDRGLFDTAPHCQPGYILVNNKCRLEA